MGVVTTWSQGSAVLTTGSAPAMGYINRYNASGSSLGVTLLALSGLNVGARTMVQKDTLDVSQNTVTFIRNGSDVFDDGSTGFILANTGEARTLQVVDISGVKKWRITEAMNPYSSGGSPSLTQYAGSFIPPGYGQYVPDHFEIASGIEFEIGSGSVMEIG